MRTYNLKTKFTEAKVYLEWGYYGNDRKALTLIGVEDDQPIVIPTVNIPDVQLYGNETIIKDYSENEGILNWLQKNEIVGPVKRYVTTGFVQCPVVDFLI